MAEQPASPDPILHDPQNDLRKRAMRRLIAAIVLIAAAVAALTFLSNYSPEKPATPSQQQTAAVPEKPVPTDPPPVEPPVEEPPVEEPPVQPAEVPAEPQPALAEAAPVAEPPPPPQVAPEPGKAPVRPAAVPAASKPAPSSATPRERLVEQPAVRPAAAEKAAPPRAVERQPAPPLRQEPAPKGYVVQLGVFTNYDNARQLQERLAQNGIKSYTETRLNVGPFQNKAEADRALAKLRSLGISAVVAPTH